jgi:DNA-binding PadR family transcriptional regulator
VPRRNRANPLALAVLVSLYERPMHPYEVAQTLRARAKQESVRLNYGSLYAVVDSLEKRELIRATETVREGRRPERTIYQITEKGSREMVDWLSELLSVPEKEYPSFMVGLTFLPALEPDDAVDLLRQRAQALEIRLAAHRGAVKVATDMGLPRLFELESELEDRLLQAELEFVNGLVEDIEKETLGGLDLWRSFATSDGAAVSARLTAEISSRMAAASKETGEPDDTT